ncbi:MAG: 3-deoxy-manno-octulosonate cytidylyltransferase [Rhodoferax sp.]|nr:3-deoxy-manno-octulosonate cytidylyltransferase [Rhodoferax sp.]
MAITVLIPARLASTRLPNKPLADICGVPMVVRVAQAVRAGVSPDVRIVVAGDHPSIIRACEIHGVEALLTRNDHTSGSDRLAEASRILALAAHDIVVNVQGDEPLINPDLVPAVAELLIQHTEAVMATAAHAIDTVADYTNPNIVKVVLDSQKRALYFSRAPIPWWRDGLAQQLPELPPSAPLRHVGIYAYRVEFLQLFPQLSPAPMEITEALEQLRAMWHGYRIAVHVSRDAPGVGVDTPDDLERVRALFSKRDRG